MAGIDEELKIFFKSRKFESQFSTRRAGTTQFVSCQRRCILQNNQKTAVIRLIKDIPPIKSQIRINSLDITLIYLPTDFVLKGIEIQTSVTLYVVYALASKVENETLH